MRLDAAKRAIKESGADVQLVCGGLFLLTAIFALVNMGREGHCIHFWLLLFCVGKRLFPHQSCACNCTVVQLQCWRAELNNVPRALGAFKNNDCVSDVYIHCHCTITCSRCANMCLWCITRHAGNL